MNSLEGKSIDCHQCKGEAVWVDLGERVGRYHYCRECKIETGPFAKSNEQPVFPFMDSFIFTSGSNPINLRDTWIFNTDNGFVCYHWKQGPKVPR